jgi:uncharacterized protein (DUF362 family)
MKNKDDSDTISRRDFLRKSAAIGTAAAFSMLFPSKHRLGAAQNLSFPDLVAIKGSSPDKMFDTGIAELGGMQNFLLRGQTVLIKPNMSWSSKPEIGATTSPELVGRIAEHCFEAGAKKVYVSDNTLDTWKLCIDYTGIKSSLDSTGAKLVPGNSKGYYQEVDIPNGKTLKQVRVHELYLESDLIINVPVLKHHGSTNITSALKNLMGVIWDRGYYHSRGLNQCIADFPLLKKPTLNVIDAYRVMKSGGPRGVSYNSVIDIMKMQIISTDIVAADTAAAKTWGTTPQLVRYIGLAEANGLGTSKLESLNIKRIVL